MTPEQVGLVLTERHVVDERPPERRLLLHHLVEGPRRVGPPELAGDLPEDRVLARQQGPLHVRTPGPGHALGHRLVDHVLGRQRTPGQDRRQHPQEPPPLHLHLQAGVYSPRGPRSAVPVKASRASRRPQSEDPTRARRRVGGADPVRRGLRHTGGSSHPVLHSPSSGARGPRRGGLQGRGFDSPSGDPATRQTRGA